tara:strand:+ start:155 stop:1543 length:1389 start_codon:yes stop_codon:yes gene_type:complete
MLVPLAFAIGNGEDIAQEAFTISAAFSFFIGVTILLATNRINIPLGRRDFAILIPLIAITTALLSALPFYLSGAFQSIFDASFESLSGLTTTGFTLLPDLRMIGSSELLWRAILQWVGGYSTLILVIWALPFLGFGGLFAVLGNTATNQTIAPQLSFKKIVVSLLTVYLIISLLCFIALFISGLPIFEAVCYTMSTVSTGGFLVGNESPLRTGNRPVEIILVIFMMLGAMNFILHGKLLTGSAKDYLRDQETQNFLVFILISLAVAIAIADNSKEGILNIYHAMVQIISVITTTGYSSSTPNTRIPDFYLLLLLILAVLGGTNGSTAGGFKVVRLIFLLQQSKQELFRLIHPHSMIPISYAGHSISTESLKILSVFSVSFLAILGLLAISLSLSGLEFSQAITLAIATITNSGPNIIESSGGSGLLLDLPWVAKLSLMLGMLMGRLEILCLLVLLNFSFWRN